MEEDFSIGNGSAEAIEDIESLGALLADDLQIGLPHIGTDEDDLRGHFVADDGEESLKGFDRSFFSDPKQARNVEVDLLNRRQAYVAFGVLDLVDSDGVDLVESTMPQPKGDDMLDCVEDLVPGCAKGLRRLFP